MAFLFQSNPDQWSLLENIKPGKYVSWFVSRYKSYMYPGVPVLLWQSKGSDSKNLPYKGLYGWGITTEEVKLDVEGRSRIRLQYIEHWIPKLDPITNEPCQRAPLPADKVLSLPSWKEHLLATMPIGTNFLVNSKQLEELFYSLIDEHFPKTQFRKVIESNSKGIPLNAKEFISVEIPEL